jgi:hypothetical protein
MQRTCKDIRVTQSMLRHNSIQSTMKYTEASNEDLRAAMAGLDWGRHSSQPTSVSDETVELPEPALPDRGPNRHTPFRFGPAAFPTWPV